MLIDLIRGLTITEKWFLKSKVTLQYPKERWQPAERFRGALRINKDTCIGCGMCARACPNFCIVVKGEKAPADDPEKRKRVPVIFDLDYARCLYCGLCWEACPVKPDKAIYLCEDYELSQYSRAGMILDMDTLHEGLKIERYKK
jgi:NADH-quinone oxidoreductase chain I